MKKLYSLLMILALVATFSACSKDDAPSDLPKDPIASKLTKDTKTVANENSLTTVTAKFELSDYKEIEKFAKYVKKGTLNTKTAEIKFSDLPESSDIKLTKVRLSLASNPKENVQLSDVTSEISFSDTNHLAFLQKVLNEVVSRGSSTVKIEFESNQLISNPLMKISINLDGRFDFK